MWARADKEHYGEPLPDFTKHAYTFVAKEGKDIFGYITIKIELGVVCVDSLIVGHNVQRQGIGTKLIKKAEEKTG